MVKETSKAGRILTLGILGMIGVLITIISDLFLIGKPTTAYSFLKYGTESMWDIAPWRITIGAFLGVVVLPFQLLGLIPVYYSLKPSGRVLPFIAVITNAHTLLMGVAFHISYAYLGTGWSLYHKSGLQNNITSEMVSRFDFYWRILVVIMLLEIIFGSVIFALIIGKGNSLYPKWMALLNPLCIVLYLFPLIFALPSPIGGYIAPTYLNLSTMIFFGVTLGVGYKKLKKLDN